MCYGISSPRWSPTPDSDLITSTKIEWPCRDEMDCSLNGACVAGECACNPAWSGKRCETLELLPATRGAGYRGLDGGKNTSSWGGAVLRDDSGKYHMWAAEMTDHCGIGAWAQNSRIIRAVADDPSASAGIELAQRLRWNRTGPAPQLEPNRRDAAERLPTGDRCSRWLRMDHLGGVPRAPLTQRPAFAESHCAGPGWIGGEFKREQVSTWGREQEGLRTFRTSR